MKSLLVLTIFVCIAVADPPPGFIRDEIYCDFEDDLCGLTFYNIDPVVQEKTLGGVKGHFLTIPLAQTLMPFTTLMVTPPVDTDDYSLQANFTMDVHFNVEGKLILRIYRVLTNGDSQKTFQQRIFTKKSEWQTFKWKHGYEAGLTYQYWIEFSTQNVKGGNEFSIKDISYKQLRYYDHTYDPEKDE